MKTLISPSSLQEHGFLRLCLPNGQIIYIRNGIIIMWAHRKWFFVAFHHDTAYLQPLAVAYIEDIPA